MKLRYYDKDTLLIAVDPFYGMGNRMIFERFLF